MAVEQRDGRCLSAMTDETKAIHARLEMWARWNREHIREYPAENWIAKWMQFGTDGVHSSKSQHLEDMPPYVKEVEAAVVKLGAIDKEVICTYYLRWEARESMAKRCHMRLMEFDNVLRRARQRLRWKIME